MRIFTLSYFILGGLCLTGCATNSIPFDKKPSSFASASVLAKRTAAAQTKCNDGAKPITRLPPIMPKNAFRTGHVSFIFDLDDTGALENIRVTKATEEIFVRPTLRSLETWKYTERSQGEPASNRKNICSSLMFSFRDERGMNIPTWSDVEAENAAYQRYKNILASLKRK